jgi:uncharacterized membrane protein YczE
MPRRLVQLFAGLVLYGISDSMLLLAGLGLDPWDVLHQGLSRRTGVPTGTWVIIVGAAVLRVVRTGIEATVLLIGWLLGGTVGIGTLVYAAAIGPLAHIFVPLFSRQGTSGAAAPPSRESAASTRPHR